MSDSVMGPFLMATYWLLRLTNLAGTVCFVLGVIALLVGAPAQGWPLLLIAAALTAFQMLGYFVFWLVVSPWLESRRPRAEEE